MVSRVAIGLESIRTKMRDAIPAAQYVRMSTEHQRYSTENQWYSAGVRSLAIMFPPGRGTR